MKRFLLLLALVLPLSCLAQWSDGLKTPSTAFTRTLLRSADAATARGILGVSASSGAQVFTNDTHSIYPVGLDPTNGTFILSTNRGALILGHANPFYVNGGANTSFMVARDQSKGDPDTSQVLFLSQRDMNPDAQTNWFEFQFSGSSALSSGFANFQMDYQNQDGVGEAYYMVVDGDVNSQFAFTRSLPGTLDQNAMVLSPNFSGQDISPLTAYKFGTSYAVTNGDLAEFWNGGVLEASISKDGGLEVKSLSVDSVSANLIYAGPGTGGPATATFRSLVQRDFGSGTVLLSSLAQSSATTLQIPQWSGSAWLPVAQSWTNSINQTRFITNLVDGVNVDASISGQLFITNASFAIGGFKNTDPAWHELLSITYSNSSASAITITGPPNATYFGSASTNSLSVAAGKEAIYSFWIRPNRTNCVNISQQ